MQAMGLAPADYETGGKAGYGSTSTSGRDPDAVGDRLRPRDRRPNPARHPRLGVGNEDGGARTSPGASRASATFASSRG